MSRTKKKTSSSPLRFFAILATIVTVFMYLNAFAAIRESSRGYFYDYKESDYAYPLIDGDYGSLYQNAVRDMGRDHYSGDIPAYRALAFYYEQAVLMRAYEEGGDAQKTEAFRARMNEYEAQLGPLAEEAAKVRTKIGMDP